MGRAMFPIHMVFYLLKWDVLFAVAGVITWYQGMPDTAVFAGAPAGWPETWKKLIYVLIVVEWVINGN
jgi:hypothetical protein